LTASSGQWIQLGYNVYNSAGRITSITIPGSNDYICLRRQLSILLSVTQYSRPRTRGYTTRYTYSISTNLALAHALASITNPDGTQQFFSFDTHGRLSQTALGGGAQAIHYAYGVNGTVAATDADAARRLTISTTAASWPSLPISSDARSYSAMIPSATSSRSPIRRADICLCYNAQAQMVQSTDPLGDLTKFTYGSFNTLASVTDPNGNTTQYNTTSMGI